MNTELDVLIVGGGLAGLSLACALSGTPWHVGVVEAAPPKAPDGWDTRIYAISPANVRFLQTLGIWDRLDSTRIAPVFDMQIYGDAGGQLHFDAYGAGVSALAWILESSLMHLELWQTVRRQAGLSLFCPARPADLSVGHDRLTLTLDDGRRLQTRLLVAADGAGSWVRNAAGLDAQTRVTSYHEHAVVANFRCEAPHHNTAFQWFADEGILAWLPLPDQHMSMVWSLPNRHAKALIEETPQALAKRVATAGGERLGALTCVNPAQGFPLRLTRMASPVAHRLALIGDAAHTIHPLSGHGINLGFQDAFSLGQRLREWPVFRDPGEPALLRAHARARAEETILLQNTTHLLNRLFKPRHPLLAGLRNKGLNLTDRLPVLRNALTRYAVEGHF